MPATGLIRIVKFSFVIGVFALTAFGHTRAATLTGRGGTTDWGETPVIVAVPSTCAAGQYVLEGPASGTTVPAVVFVEGDRRYLAAILPSVAASEPFSYVVKPSKSDTHDGVRFVPEGDDVAITIDGRPFATYRKRSWSKPILFPVIGPTGDRVTRAFPMENLSGEDHDHPHQRSFWFTHGDVNGIDFWAQDNPGTPSEKRKKGMIREVERDEIVKGPVLARLRTVDDWMAPNGDRICRDRRTWTFHHTKDVRIIDFDIVIEASDGPVTFGDTKEGMFGLRLASSMDVKRKTGGKITNAEGVTDLKAWGQASPWVDYVGPVKGKTVGVAILNHPDSFRFPTTWHVRDYGLFAANPFGWKAFGRSERGDHTIPSGETLHFAYRVILHTGDTQALGVPGYFEAYAGPSKLEFHPD